MSYFTEHIEQKKQIIKKTIVKRKVRKKRRVPLLQKSSIKDFITLEVENKPNPENITQNSSIPNTKTPNPTPTKNKDINKNSTNNQHNTIIELEKQSIPQLPHHILHHDTTPFYSFESNFPKTLLLNPNRTTQKIKSLEKTKNNIETFSTVFDHVFIINSLKDHSSWLHIIQELQKLGETEYERFPMVDGKKKIYNNKWNSHRLNSNKRLLTDFSVSIIESIVQILEISIKKKYKSIVLLQDSITFLKKTPNILKGMKKRLPKIWKIILLGCCQNSWTRVYRAQLFGYFANDSSKGLFALAIHNTCYTYLIQMLKYRYNRWLYEVCKKYNKQCIVISPNIAISTKETLQNKANHFKWKKDLYNNCNHSFKQPLVSVIITCYNSENTIFHAIQSLSNQSYQFIEIIVVDDHSTDKTIMIVEKCMEKDPRISLVKNNRNYGVFISRNIGIKYSHGYYITFQDADDISITRRLALQVRTMEKSKKYQACIGRFIDKITQKYITCSPTLMIRRDVVDYVGYFDSVRVGADEEYRQRMERLGLKIYPIKKYLYTCYDRLIEANGIGNPYSILLSKKHGRNTDIRKVYYRSYEYYHNQLKDKENLMKKKFYTPFPMIQRSFNIQYDNYEHLQKFMEPQLSIETLQQLSTR